MMSNYIPISELKVIPFFMNLINYFKILIIVFSIISIIVLTIGLGNIDIIRTVINYNIIFYIGIFMSAFIHEYSHLLMMKLFGIKYLKIDTSFLRFSLITNENVKGKQLLVIALAGPLSCGIVASLLLIINILLGSNMILLMIILIYYFHLINIIPCFGDGKMIIKAIVTL